MLKRDFIAFHGYWRESIDDRNAQLPGAGKLFSLAGNSSNFFTRYAGYRLTAENFQRAGYVHRNITAADN